jgi:subtilase family serine protease
MRTALRISAVSMATGIAFAGAASAAPATGERTYETFGGLVIVPASSIPHPETPDRMHTNTAIFVPAGHHADNAKPGAGGETAASLACVYGLTKKTPGCNPTTVKTVPKTGSKVVVIVDAYDDPTAEKDLAAYSKEFGLPTITAKNFEVVYASGKQPAQDSTGGWELEESLDVDMAHALAPGAKIILMEADDDSTTALIAAEKAAIKLVQKAGGGEVSNSWGGGDGAGETSYTKDFEGAKAVVFVAAGDQTGPSFPAVLQDVVSVGGTSIQRNTKGDYLSQGTWNQTGGGVSGFIKVPAYQSGNASVSAIVGSFRGTPDIALVANPDTPVWAYDSTPYNGQVLKWFEVGGTSVATPLAAALVNSAGSFNASAEDELTEIYANLGNAKAFYDIKQGQCPNDPRGRAEAGYDLCTGVGAPIGTIGK